MNRLLEPFQYGFMVDAMNATGARFDSEAFWKRFNESLTREQKGVKEWTQFGE